MPKITKYLPNYMEGFETPTQEFRTLEELENISFVKTWRSWKDFERFTASWQPYKCIGEPDLSHFLLSAHLKDGGHYVIGLLEPDAKDVLKTLNEKDYNHESEERALASS